MTDATTYRLHVDDKTKTLVLGILSLLTMGQAIFFVLAILFPDTVSPPPSLSFVLPSVAILAFFWYRVLSLPQTLILHPDGTLEFQAPLGKSTVRISELERIFPDRFYLEILRFQHQRGYVHAPPPAEGGEELAAAIRAGNSKVEIRGL